MFEAILALCVAPEPPALPVPRLNPPPMIFRELGDFRRTVQTDSEEARLWFDQGMALMLGYNFDGAIASYLEAIRRDPEFAMAWWGIAYASGPNQNNPAIIPPKDEWSFCIPCRGHRHRHQRHSPTWWAPIPQRYRRLGLFWNIQALEPSLRPELQPTGLRSATPTGRDCITSLGTSKTWTRI